METISLPKISHNGKDLDVAIFGPNTYKGNLKVMQNSFMPATTSESILVAAYKFEADSKCGFIDTHRIQAGHIVRTQDGVFTNTAETNAQKLKQLINGAEKVNGIYFINGIMAFAPYETFNFGRGWYDGPDSFSRGGLARALEHTHEKAASKLRKMALLGHYKDQSGVDVSGFSAVERPVARIVEIYSYGLYSWMSLGVHGDRNIDGDRLLVAGDNAGYFYGGDGLAFGVSKKEAF